MRYRHYLSLWVAVMLAGLQMACTPASQAQDKAPELTGISQWINSPPLTMKELQGKVVLVDFWDYSCINCLRTFPYLQHWYEKYHDQGFTIIGVHSPEFAFAENMSHVKQAVKDFKLDYPIAMDNDMQTWRAWRNQYWPAEYLVNKKGEVILHHFGEGKYLDMENAIRQQLDLKPLTKSIQVDTPDFARIGSPEMYFGTLRMRNMANHQAHAHQSQSYTAPSTLALNQYALGGEWHIEDEYAELDKDKGHITLKFDAANVYMVAASDTPQTIEVSIDGKSFKKVDVHTSKLYTLRSNDTYGQHRLRIRIPHKGFRIYTFTFG